MSADTGLARFHQEAARTDEQSQQTEFRAHGIVDAGQLRLDDITDDSADRH